MKILTIPNKMLYRQAVPVGEIDAKIQGIIDRMLITMYQHKGIGLAANQVGVLKQIVVLNLKCKPMVLINPIVRDLHNGHIWEKEYCLSIPGYSKSIERAGEIHVISCDRHGKRQIFNAYGLLARCIQHEVDHLRGVLINKGE